MVNGKNFFLELENALNHIQKTIEESASYDFVPRANIKETDKVFVLELEVPGVKKSNIDIVIDNEVLVISGSKEIEDLVEAEKYTKIETAYGKFQRKFSLKGNFIDKENITAKSKNGILYVTVPKIEKPKNETFKKVVVE